MLDQQPDEAALEAADLFEVPEKAEATRVSSGRIINKLKDVMPNLIGGSADLGPSNKTYMNGEGDFAPENRGGRNIHFGVRELAMAGIANGLALSGLRPYVGTFFVFSDYAKPMARLAALMNLPVTYVYSHDSIGVGEDGPTHQPIEHMASYRSIPNMVVFRPADAKETAAGWTLAAKRTTGPTALILTRQNVPQLEETSKEAVKGAYILRDSKAELPQGILIASGSEVAPTLKAAQLLEKEGIDVRVVSMPSMELFEMQPEDYRESILPRKVKARTAVEASKDFGWGRYVGLDGEVVGMKSFGVSAPGSQLFDYFGFTPENIAETMKRVLARTAE
ncbi:transketolase C-terminal domain-containing protein [Allobaculum sp. Allo2]